ncbi:MAG TPA: agmatinase [Gemmatimonadales bacterium]|nr:agmatinase [Gemmatimonadales bacterium]
MPATLLGVPFDGASSFQRGAALAPAAIRAAFHSPSTNTWNEDVTDTTSLFLDAGDLAIDGVTDPRDSITESVAELLQQGTTPILLGGDHSITWPIVRAIRARAERLTILHLDAHPDLYHSFDGDRLSHASPFARIMEEKLANHLVQIGVRTMNGHQRDQARRFGVEVVPMRSGLEAMVTAARRLDGPVFLSLDLDVLDPAFAPGVSHAEPGGLTTREVIGIIQAIPRGRLVGADLVELNPANDLRDLTARVAVKLLKEIVARV